MPPPAYPESRLSGRSSPRRRRGRRGGLGVVLGAGRGVRGSPRAARGRRGLPSRRSRNPGKAWPCSVRGGRGSRGGRCRPCGSRRRGSPSLEPSRPPRPRTRGCRGASALASAHHKLLVPHQTQPTIGTPANLHFVSVFVPGDTAQEFIHGGWNSELHGFFEEPLRFEGGRIRVPTGPGLGLALDEKRMKASAV